MRKDSGWSSLSLPVKRAGVLGLRGRGALPARVREYPRSSTVPANEGESSVMASTFVGGRHLRATKDKR